MRRFRLRCAGVAAVAWTVCLLPMAAIAARVEEPARVRDVIYGRKFGMALTMEVLKPAKPNGIGVIVMVSGGFSSDISMVDASFVGLGWLKPLTDRGDTV